MAKPPVKGTKGKDSKGGKKSVKKEYVPPKVMRRGDDPFGAGNHHPFFSKKEETTLEKPPIRSYFRLLLTPLGRAAQSDYWMWGFIWAAVLFGLRWFANNLVYMPDTPAGWAAVWIAPHGPQMQWCLLPLYSFVCVTINRYHDTGNYGSGIIFLFTPFLWAVIKPLIPAGQPEIEFELARLALWAGPVLIIGYAALKGKMEGSNKFGDDPTEV